MILTWAELFAQNLMGIILATSSSIYMMTNELFKDLMEPLKF